MTPTTCVGVWGCVGWSVWGALVGVHSRVEVPNVLPKLIGEFFQL